MNGYRPRHMTTKASRHRSEQLRAFARLISQSRINAGEAAALGRVAESHAWTDVAEFLECVLEDARVRGFGLQGPLF